MKINGMGIALFLAVGVLCTGIEYMTGTGMALMFSLVFWVSVAEGCIALVAAVETANSQWIDPIKRKLFSVYPVILLAALLFPLMIYRMDLYPWTEHPGKWLNTEFFLTRNIIVLLVVFIGAFFYIRASLNNSRSKQTLAVIYLFLFVTSQSFVAFDWVMPMEYPWISTLFGPYFFVEALYLAMAVAGFYLFALSRKSTPEDFQAYVPVLRDISTFIFGFSLFWAGLFYAQYLVIWYGHIPEESSYIVHRLAHSPIRELSMAIVPILFVVPFLTLVSKKAKITPPVTLFVSALIFLGVIVERIVMILPVAPLNPMMTVVEFAGFGILVMMLMRQAGSGQESS